MFQITDQPLESMNLTEGMSSPASGALATFAGIVRNENEGRAVQSLEYEAAETLCQNEVVRIFAEAQQKWPILAIKCYHRTGLLKVGELAVWVGVSAGHRQPAFDACRYIIDQLKVRLPIWKKETYTNGDSGWVNCQCGDHS